MDAWVVPVNKPFDSTGPGTVPTSTTLVDIALGAAATSVAAGRPVARRVVAVAGPVMRGVLRPPMLGSRYQPQTWLTRLAKSGEHHRRELLEALSELLDELTPAVAETVLRRVDLTALVRRYVDLDAVVEDVDLDAVAARLDVDAVVNRLDLNRIVRERVDLDAVAADLDVEAVVNRLDLNRIVRERVDLDALVATVDLDAVAGRLDLAAVIDRIDLVGLAEDVIAEVDLPGIIRESTGSMASDTVLGVRMQSISGDEALGRAVDRLRLRRRRHVVANGAPDVAPPAETLPPQPRPGAADRP
jgi:hypothetical protein